ncbi:nucleotidyltransferase substrate binding protein [Zobellella maritima]|uniref:nucleotidyltransferase substrate binding protein n=1 Tax=Zobellella maritima TaxID=2059725 RepID=UPI000E303A89|nr:nucleotidyltransferase substrate binding protein [Zobellella maritima]
MLDLSSFEKALAALGEAIEATASPELKRLMTPAQYHTLRAGLVQSFEFTYELSWKFIKRWLEANLGAVYVDGVSRRELFRIAAEHRLIDDVEQWVFFHKLRNLTSHTYDQDTANEVCEGAVLFYRQAEGLLSVLASRND